MDIAGAPTPIPLGGGLKAVCEAIWKIEADLGLFQHEVAGVHYWRLIRWEVCRAFTQRTGPPAGPSDGGSTLVSRINHEMGALRHSLKFANWSAAGLVDTVVVPFPRKHRRNGASVDIHSERILNDPAFGRILVLERTEADASLTPSPAVFVADRDRGRPEAVARALLRFAGLITPLAPVWAQLDAATRRELNLPFPISLQSLALRVALFKEYRAVSRRMLRATGARRFISVWQDQVMFAAARDLGWETVEIQHAAFSKYNLHYHFPYRGPISYIPDYLLTFGQYWAENVELPAGTRPVVVGSSNMAAQRAIPPSRRARRVVICSQGPTYWPLLDAVLEAAALAPDWEFIFRPHPRENFEHYRLHISAREGAPSNLRLSQASDDVYHLLATAEVQIGVASTTLFEGMNLGCRTIVFDAPGCEAMECVLAAGDAVIATSAQEIAMRLSTAPRARNVEVYYASPRSISGALAT